MLRKRALAVAVGAAFSAPYLAYALPTGGEVVSGSSTISQTNPSTLAITQSTSKSIINWQGFNTSSGESVLVTQPAGGMALYRVFSPVEFYGNLTANGQIFLSSPFGVLFGAGSSVNVGGLTATTLSISNEDFNSGHYVFSNSGSAGSVVNQGTLVAPNGYVALLGPQVSNTGVISARMGTVAMAAGDRVSLDMVGDGLVSVSVDQSALNAAAINKGSIQADGGNVLLTARSANALLDTVINTDGVIRANSIQNRNGTIVLDGGNAGIVSVSGTVEAKGEDAGTTGGTIKALGQYVGVALPGNTATVDASGDAGGGSIIIGGNFHGAGPEQNASKTFIGTGATINSDAVNTGDGGQVAVWSDNGTQFYGSISARGGAQSGDGGFVEVSGKNGLIYSGVTDLRAPNGIVGTLLLDPNDLTIVSGVASTGTNMDCTASADDCTGTVGTAPFTDTATGAGAQITDGSLNNQLGLGNVQVNADSITANSGISINTSGHNLDYVSGSSIILGGTYTGAGILSLNYTTTLDLSSNTFNIAAVTVTAAGGATGTISGSGLTYVLNNVTPDAGSVSVGGGSISWTATPNINDSTGTVNFQTSGSVTGNVTAQTLNYSTYTAAETYDIANGAGQTTGIGGTHTGVTTVTGNSGNAATNLIKGGTTYTLTNATPNAGTDGTVSWTNFGALNAGTSVNFQASGSVTGNVTAPTLNFSTYGSDVSATVTGANAGTITGTGGFSGVSTINANGAQSNTMGGTGQTYALTNGTPDAGSSNSVSWTNFKNITDTTGTVNFQTSGSVTGNVSAQTLNYSAYTQDLTLDVTAGTITNGGVGGTITLNGTKTVNADAAQNNTVGGTGVTYALTNGTANAGSGNGYNWTAFKNVNDGTGTVNFQASGSVTGNVTAPTLNYGSYATPVTFNASDASGGTTGIGTTWTGVTTVTGSGNSDTVTGANQAWHLTGVNAGNNGTVTWTSFENVTDTGTGVHSFAGGGSLAGQLTDTAGGTGTLSGTITTGGLQTYNASESLGGATTLTSTGSTVSLLGSVTGANTLAVNANTTATITGGVNGPTSLTVTAPSIVLGSVATNGLQQYNGALSLNGTYSTGGGNFQMSAGTTVAGNTTVSVGAGRAIFNNVSGAGGSESLAVNSSTATNGETFGTISNLGSITTDSPGGVTLNGNVSTTNIAFNDAVTTAGAVTFTGSTVTANNAGNNFGGLVTVNLTSGGTVGLTAGANGAQVNGAGPVNLGTSTITGPLGVTSNGDVTQTGSVWVSGTLTVDPGAGNIVLNNAGNNFTGALNLGTGATTGSISVQSNFVGTGTIQTTGDVYLNSSTGTTGTPAGSNTMVILDSTGNVNLGQLFTPPATLATATPTAAQWSFGAGTTTPVGNFREQAGVGVTVGGVTVAANALQTTVTTIVSSAQAAATAAAAGEAANTFGTDSVAEQVEYGFAGDVGVLPPMDHRLEGTGISVPKCFNESREGVDCGG